MYSTKSYELKKEEYNYLLPAIKNKLNSSSGKYYFTGSYEELEDMLNRLKGLYDNYDELNKIIVYNCSKNGSLKPFRESINNI